MTAFLNRRQALTLTGAAVLGATYGANAFAASAIKPAAHIDPAQVLAAGKERDMIEGDANAPVTIVEYASLTCGHCADFYVKILPIIREKYIKTGKVRLIFREIAGDPLATAGFMLARCLPEDRYFPMVQVLFEQQTTWVTRDALPPLKQIAKLAGYTDETFEACLNNQDILNGVNGSTEGAKSLDVKYTPTFFINGDKYEGALPIEEMSKAIESHL